jgi:hypothetical protein
MSSRPNEETLESRSHSSWDRSTASRLPRRVIDHRRAAADCVVNDRRQFRLRLFQLDVPHVDLQPSLECRVRPRCRARDPCPCQEMNRWLRDLCETHPTARCNLRAALRRRNGKRSDRGAFVCSRLMIRHSIESADISEAAVPGHRSYPRDTARRRAEQARRGMLRVILLRGTDYPLDRSTANAVADVPRTRSCEKPPGCARGSCSHGSVQLTG